MAIYPNGLNLLRSPARFTGGSPASGVSHAAMAVVAANMGGKRHNCFVSATWSRLAGRPYGYGGETPWMAITAGGMAHASSRDVVVSATATGVMGFPIAGAASFVIGFADADILPDDDTSPLREASASFSFSGNATGSLISTASGSASFSVSGSATATGTISGAGAASFSVSCAQALLGGLADLSGNAGMSVDAVGVLLPVDDTSPLRSASASFSMSASGWMLPVDDSPPERAASASFSIGGSLSPYAIGHMSGSTVDTSVLTVDAIKTAVWSAIAADNNETGTMGNKLNTASSGGVDYDSLANAIVAALTATTIPVDTKKINGVTLSGDGSPGHPWGPV